MAHSLSEKHVTQEIRYKKGKSRRGKLTNDAKAQCNGVLRRNANHDGSQRAGVCPESFGVPGGARSPGSLLPPFTKGSRSVVRLRSGARVLRGCRTTIH